MTVDLEEGKKLTFSSFDFVTVSTRTAHLMASEGKEYDADFMKSEFVFFFHVLNVLELMLICKSIYIGSTIVHFESSVQSRCLHHYHIAIKPDFR